MTFDLPATGTEPRPAFTNANECKDWLTTVPLANAVQAQAALMRQLNLLHRFSLQPNERFEILEVLAGPLIEVQEDASKKFAGKPLPFAPHEQAALDSTLEVWREFALGYLRCFDAICHDHTSMSSLQTQSKACATSLDLAVQAATLAQRLISVFADWQVALYRGEQLPDSDYWRKLHQVFLAAETLGVAGRAVKDPLRHGREHTTSVLAAYGECNLLSTANVYEFPARHLAWVARWARRWGAKLTLLKAPPEDISNRAVPLWLDLESSAPPSYMPQPAQGGRWLDTTELRKSLIARITLLEQGRAPADLQLGDDVTQPAAGQLLQHLLQRWCKGGAQRRHERHSATTACGFVGSFEPVHFHLSGGKVFHAPTRSDSALRREREEFEIFGERKNSNDKNSAKADAHLEAWRLLDESAAGMRVTRPLKDGVRIGAGMVIAIKTSDSQRFTLGCVRWALREGEEALVAGIQLFPGETQPVAVRPVETSGPKSAWRQGFILPEIPALKEPASVVLPPGTFRLDRSVEVLADEKLQVLKLFKVVDRGIEFERCNFHN
ncbi:MAG: hypothetical protein K9J74_02675 [Sulfuritalea sp.]|nr:hypothetical protein [Sulfuritalea sp.]